MGARKPYHQPQRASWWLRNPAYRRYMLREATALPLLVYSLTLLVGLYRFTQGKGAFLAWLNALSSPAWLMFHGLALAAVLLHSVSWLALVPKILVVHTRFLQLRPNTVLRLHQAGAIAGSAGIVGLAVVIWRAMP